MIRATAAGRRRWYYAHGSDLPLSCLTPEMALWNLHRRVYRAIEDEPSQQAQCPHCGVCSMSWAPIPSTRARACRPGGCGCDAPLHGALSPMGEHSAGTKGGV